MKVVLCHKTALEFWDAAEARTLAPSQVATLSACAYRSGDLEMSGVQGLCLSRPLHVLVDDPTKRNSLDGWHFHVWSTVLPSRSLYKVCDGIYVTSPELSYYQVASEMRLVPAIVLGMELCGSFSTHLEDAFDDEERKMFERPPVTTAKRIKRFIERVAGPNSRCVAMQAAQWLVDGSASPAESASYMQMCLPYRYGGCGFETPELNREFELSPRAQALTGSHKLRCDFYWHRQGIAIEYDSDENHSAPWEARRDAIRKDVLEFQKVTVISLRTGQLKERESFEATAPELARLLGKRLVLPAGHEAARQALNRELFGPDKFDWSNV